MELPKMRLNSEALARFDDAIQKEWAITNGLGGYASSTVLGINTRKYHGLLIAALDPLGRRTQCLAKLDEEVEVENSVYPLFANEFKDNVFPHGHLYLKEFSLSPMPQYVYGTKNVNVQKTIFMPDGKNAVVAIYKVSNKNKCEAKLRIFPVVNCRHVHDVTDRWKNQWNFENKRDKKEVILSFKTPRCALAIAATEGRYFDEEKWIESIYYREEAARGESCLEDCYQAGYFETFVEAGKTKSLAVVAFANKDEGEAESFLEKQPRTMYDLEMMLEKELERRQSLLSKFYEQNPALGVNDWLSWVVLASDMFIVKSEDKMQSSVIAGYHWFETWGRDAFISMPGLMFVTGRFEDARRVFLMFKRYFSEGLVPNFVSDALEEPAYNSVDATLWFADAVLQYLKYTGDFKFVRENLWGMLKAIIEWFIKGTKHDIRLDGDGLVSHGAQLTWMDAVVDGQPVTPRGGKAVEVQALWFNTLKIIELLAKKYSEVDIAEEYARMAEKARKSFAEKFWSSEKGYLFDVVNEGFRDDSLRPNQIIAVALDFTMLDKTRNEKIVDAVHRELLTPYGLRTLARNDPKYIGVYTGDRKSRDKAYHNGTVWPWLLGPFTKAFLKVKGYADYRREQALSFLLPLFTEQIQKAGLGLISEIFDGEPPHTPRGCIAQAWSVAEPLRAYVEDVMQINPRYAREIFV